MTSSNVGNSIARAELGRLPSPSACDGTGICSCSSAYRRFRKWIDAGVFEAFWRLGLLEYDELRDIGWRWTGR